MDAKEISPDRGAGKTRIVRAIYEAPQPIVYLPADTLAHILRLPHTKGHDGPMTAARHVLWIAVRCATEGHRSCFASPNVVARDFDLRPPPGARPGTSARALQRHRATLVAAGVQITDDGRRYRLPEGRFYALPLAVAVRLVYETASPALRAALHAIPSLSAAHDRAIDATAVLEAGADTPQPTVRAKARRCALRSRQGATRWCRAVRDLRRMQLIDDNRPGDASIPGRPDRHPTRVIYLTSALRPLDRSELEAARIHSQNALQDTRCRTWSDPRETPPKGGFSTQQEQPPTLTLPPRTEAEAVAPSAQTTGRAEQRTRPAEPGTPGHVSDATALIGQRGPMLVRALLGILGLIGWRTASVRACRQIAAAVGTAGVLRRIVTEHGQAINEYADQPVYYLARALAAEPPELVRSGQWEGPRLGKRPRRRCAPHDRPNDGARAAAIARVTAPIRTPPPPSNEGPCPTATIDHAPRPRQPPPRHLGWESDGTPRAGDLAARMRALWHAAHRISQ